MNTKKEELLLQNSKIKKEELKEKFKKEIEVIFEEKEEILSLRKYFLEKKIFCNSSFSQKKDILNFFETEIIDLFSKYKKEWNIELLLFYKKFYKKNEKYFAIIRVIPKTSNTQSLFLKYENEETEEDIYSDYEKEYEEKREEDYILSLANQHRIMEINSLQNRIEEELRKQKKEKDREFFI